MHHIGFHHQVLVDELGRIRVVGVNPANLGRRQVNLVDPLFLEKSAHLCLVGQVQFGVRAGDDVGLTARRQQAHDGATDHAAMAGHINTLSDSVHCDLLFL
jgi:hypothetical protein